MKLYFCCSMFLFHLNWTRHDFKIQNPEISIEKSIQVLIMIKYYKTEEVNKLIEYILSLCDISLSIYKSSNFYLAYSWQRMKLVEYIQSALWYYSLFLDVWVNFFLVNSPLTHHCRFYCKPVQISVIFVSSRNLITLSMHNL